MRCSWPSFLWLAVCFTKPLHTWQFALVQNSLVRKSPENETVSGVVKSWPDSEILPKPLSAWRWFLQVMVWGNWWHSVQPMTAPSALHLCREGTGSPLALAAKKPYGFDSTFTFLHRLQVKCRKMNQEKTCLPTAFSFLYFCLSIYQLLNKPEKGATWSWRRDNNTCCLHWTAFFSSPSTFLMVQVHFPSFTIGDTEA